MSVSLDESRLSCTSCGLPLSGSACAACGGSGLPLALADGVAGSARAYAAEAERPELGSHADLADGNFSNLVSRCASALGMADVTSADTPDGPLFRAISRGFALFFRIRPNIGDLVIEVPVVRLPLTQYVAALRLILELSDRDRSAVRYSTRGELVIARFVGVLPTMSPVAFFQAVEAVLEAALDCARVLVGSFQAREITPKEYGALTLESFPRGIVLSDELPTSSQRTALAAQSSRRVPTRELLGPTRPTPVADVPAILMPPGGSAQPKAAPAPAAAAARPTPAKSPSVPPAPKPAASPQPALRPPQREVPKPREEHTPPTAPSPADARGSNFPPAAPGPAKPVTPPAPAVTPITQVSPAAPPKAGSRHAALCELLHKAQTLGAVLSFADQPATMCLLIRATVYRTILEHEQAAPGAAAHLATTTASITKEIYITAPGKRRGSMAIPPTAPAFETMSEIVAKEGVVQSSEPLVIQPITTAQEAKQHLARYVSEIDQAPSDVDLRHFLALGALSELLVRAKLPPATQERLKGILAHARKEGPKQQVVELMMTALNRMIA